MNTTRQDIPHSRPAGRGAGGPWRRRILGVLDDLHEGGFLERSIGNVQMLFTRPGHRRGPATGATA